MKVPNPPGSGKDTANSKGVVGDCESEGSWRQNSGLTNRNHIRLCPDCGKPMQYLAQIQWDTVLYNMEGNAYIEICKDCKNIVVLHQQT